jgi:hypothetical protein
VVSFDTHAAFIMNYLINLSLYRDLCKSIGAQIFSDSEECLQPIL